MSILLATTGSKFFVGGKKAFQNRDLTVADFADEPWILINGVTNLAGAGDTAEAITSNQISVGRMRKAKGPVNGGNRQLIMDIQPDDPGQIALLAAKLFRESVSFKVEFPDAPEGGTPSMRMYTAFVMSDEEQYDEATSAMKLNVSLEIDSNLVRVAKTEAP